MELKDYRRIFEDLVLKQFAVSIEKNQFTINFNLTTEKKQSTATLSLKPRNDIKSTKKSSEGTIIIFTNSQKLSIQLFFLL